MGRARSSIRTTGDERPGGTDAAAAATLEGEGKRVFVKEIEEALLAGQVDLAVHSAKDMPVDLPDGLTIGAVLRARIRAMRSCYRRRRVPGGQCLLPASDGQDGTSPRRVAQLSARAECALRRSTRQRRYAAAPARRPGVRDAGAGGRRVEAARIR